MKTGWEYKKLGEVCDKGSSNISLNKIEDNIGEYALFGASGYVKDIDFYHNETPYIGIVKDGSGCGRVNIYPAKSSLVGTMQYIYPKQNCDIKFLMYLLQSLDLSSLVTGAAIPHIYFKDYSKFSVPVPPLPTQQSIVSELDSLSQIIADCKETLKDYDALEQSIFYDMFGDPVKNDKGWEVKKLGEVCEITSSKRIFANEYVDFGVPFYRSKEVIERSKALPISVELFISEEKYQEILSSYGVPSVGDILITAVGTIGKIWVVDTEDKFYFKDGNLVWLKNFSDDINSTYFKYSLSLLIDNYKKSYANGAAYAALTIVNLKKMECLLPPLPLQQQFASKIEAIEQMKSETKKALQEAETLFNARMDYWFN